jgi:hypothetical protein
MPPRTTLSRQFKAAVAAMLLLAAGALLWSHARTGSAAATAVHAASASAISPMDLMLKRNDGLPAHTWDAY